MLTVTLLTITGLAIALLAVSLLTITLLAVGSLAVALLAGLAVSLLAVALLTRLAIATLRVKTGRTVPLIARVLVALRISSTGGTEDLRALIILTAVLRGLRPRLFRLGLPQVFGRVVGVLPVRAVASVVEGVIVLWCHYLILSVPGA